MRHGEYLHNYRTLLTYTTNCNPNMLRGRLMFNWGGGGGRRGFFLIVGFHLKVVKKMNRRQCQELFKIKKM